MFKFPLASKESSTEQQKIVTNSDSFSDLKINVSSTTESAPCESQRSSGLTPELDEGFFDKRSISTGLYTTSHESEADQSVPTNSEY